MSILSKLLNVDHGTVSNAANLVQPLASLALDLSRAFFSATKHQVSGARSTRSAHNQGIKTKRKHQHFWVRAQEALLSIKNKPRSAVRKDTAWLRRLQQRNIENN